MEHAAVIEAAGYTADEVLALAAAPPAAAVETAPVPAGVGARTGETVEVVYGKTSIVGRMLVDSAVAARSIGHLTEAVQNQLPDNFSEADITKAVETVVGLASIFERDQLRPRTGAVAVTGDEWDRKIEALDQMLDPNTGKGYRSLKEAYCDINGISRPFDDSEFCRQILTECIGQGRSYDSRRSQESVTTTQWDVVFGDSITRRLIKEYGLASLQTWRAIVSQITPVSDFRTQRLDRVGGYGTLPAVNPAAPYQPLTTPTDEEVTYAMEKRGGTETITWEAIKNDDLHAIIKVPVRLGRSAAQTIFRKVWDLLNGNANVSYEAVALFATAHANNNLTTNALSDSALAAARKAMRTQTAYGDTSELLGAVPKFLVVPPDLEEAAFQLCTSAVAIGTGANGTAGANASDIPNMHQGMTPIVVDYFSATSANRWFVVADPNTVPTIEVGFLDGKEEPELFVQQDQTVGSVFNVDSVTYKIRHVHGVAVLDHRAFFRGGTS